MQYILAIFKALSFWKLSWNVLWFQFQYWFQIFQKSFLKSLQNTFVIQAYTFANIFCYWNILINIFNFLYIFAKIRNINISLCMKLPFNNIDFLFLHYFTLSRYRAKSYNESLMLFCFRHRTISYSHSYFPNNPHAFAETSNF